MAVQQLTNIEKAAAILVSLGVEKAAQVLAHLTYDQVQLLASQMVHTGRITPETREELCEELVEKYSNSLGDDAVGGLAFVQRILSETFGNDRASLVMEQLMPNKSGKPFMSLRSADPPKIMDVLAGENPAVIAIVMYYLPRDKAAHILAGLADGIRDEVVLRLINMDTPVPQMVSRLDELLTRKLAEIQSGDEETREKDIGKVSGARTLVEILGQAHPSVEKRTYEFLQTKDPELAEEVRKSMFVFEDINKLLPKDVQQVVRELTNQEIAISLKTASDDLKKLVFANVSENTAKMIAEEISLMGPIRVSTVEETQQKVVATVRRLAEEGLINMHVSAGGDDELMV
jgi:flagellar motor switch protein FliG